MCSSQFGEDAYKSIPGFMGMALQSKVVFVLFSSEKSFCFVIFPEIGPF